MILSILDNKYLKKQSKIYLIISIICLIFSLIYEHFSHEVYSFYMISAFLIPLILGCVVSTFLSMKNIKVSRTSNNLYNASVATFTIYFIMRGFLEIYGTTNSIINIYLIVGILLLVVSIILKIINRQE